MNALLQRIGIALPIVQAPMAGTSTPALAAASSEAGALGSISVAAMDVDSARAAIAQIRERTDRPFNVNVFCHPPAVADAAREAGWIARLAAEFSRFDAKPPERLSEIYTSFRANRAMLELLVETAPRVVSFHFGLPSAEAISRLKAAGSVLFATATSLPEALAVEAAGVDAVVAQGYEAGGHRGVFDTEAEDTRLGTFALIRLLSRRLTIPVIAAGGIMDGAGVAAAMELGACAAQLGTAFVACPESSADEGHRRALFSDAALHTVMTAAVSGRPARCLANRFTAITADVLPGEIAAYPIAYDLGKALNAAAKAKGEFGYGAQWAGQGAPLARSLPAAELIATLIGELKASGAALA
jgi:nitronate monooxygenase